MAGAPESGHRAVSVARKVVACWPDGRGRGIRVTVSNADPPDHRPIARMASGAVDTRRGLYPEVMPIIH
jgi:hypothetical protein